MPVPSDIYEKEVDFTALALRYPAFAKRIKPNGQLDFSDPESVRQLTKALLHRDFKLTLSLPEDRLCPPVPNRFNYILFAQKLLDSSSDSFTSHFDPTRRVIGLDIGTGASAIYPLLACRQRDRWLFLATEIDDKSKAFALRNVTDNGLDSRIKVLDTDTTGKVLIPSAELEKFERLDILLTNPPFYTSESELESLAKQKSRPPNSACTGAPIEMIYPGGETAFVGQLIKESKLPQNRKRIQWFSSMFGKLGSVSVIIDALRDEGCTNYAVTEFVQGQKTRRWCIAWSWLSLRPSQAVARGTDAIEKKYLPFPTELQILIENEPSVTLGNIDKELSRLNGLEFKWILDSKIFIGRSQAGDVWSRHARRRLKKVAVERSDGMDVDSHVSEFARNPAKSGENDENQKSVSSTDQSQVFAFRIECKTSTSEMVSDASNTDKTLLTLCWLQGLDSKVFESFHGWLKRKLN